MGDERFLDPDPAALGGEAEFADAGGEPVAGGPSSVAFSVLTRRHDELMGMSGVVMVGVGAGAVGEEAIVVGVKRADQSDAVPKSLDGVPVVTQVIGEVDALGDGGRKRRPR